MTWLHRLWRRKQMDEQLEKELSFHIDQHVADLAARGHNVEEAARQARLDLGGPQRVKEACRDVRGTRWLEQLVAGVQSSEPLTFALMICALSGAALAASFIPARRASRIDPLNALRRE